MIKNQVNSEFAEKIASNLLELFVDVSPSKFPCVDEPQKAADDIIRKAALKAGSISGSLALVPGPFGILTILPDLLAIWRIQAQLVADIAAIFGQKAKIRKEQMIYCLFKHSASQAVRDIAVRSGKQILIKKVTPAVCKNVLKKIGVNVSQKIAGKAVSRYIPVVGALCVGGYAYYDTLNVAKNAIQLFEKNGSHIY